MGPVLLPIRRGRLGEARMSWASNSANFLRLFSDRDMFMRLDCVEKDQLIRTTEIQVYFDHKYIHI